MKRLVLLIDTTMIVVMLMTLLLMTFDKLTGTQLTKFMLVAATYAISVNVRIFYYLQRKFGE